VSKQPDPYSSLSELDVALRKVGVIVGYLAMVAAGMLFTGWALGAKIL